MVVSEFVAFSAPIIDQLTPPTGAGAVNPLLSGYTFANAALADDGSGAGYPYVKDQFGVYYIVLAGKNGSLDWFVNTGHWSVPYSAKTAINNPALAQFGTGDVIFFPHPTTFARATLGYLAKADTDVAITIIASDKTLSTTIKIVDMGPEVEDVITQNGDVTQINVTVTAAIDLFIGATKISTAANSSAAWTVTDANSNLTSITVPADCSAGGLVAIVLESAVGKNGQAVVINFAQVKDNVGNLVANDTTAANTVLTITSDDTDWNAVWSAAP